MYPIKICASSHDIMFKLKPDNVKRQKKITNDIQRREKTLD